MLDMLATLRALVADLLSTRLFSIGETPVTAGSVLRVVVIVLIAGVLSRGVRGALRRLTRRWPGSSPSMIYTFGRVIHYVLIAVGLVVGLSTVGVDFTNLAVVLGALGIGIGFGLQDMVANFIAGLIILFERHLRVGDFIDLQSGVAGEVREIRMRATRVTTNDNMDVLVPNAEFVRGRVTNWTLDEADRRIRVPFGVAYGSDKEKVRAAGLEAADRVRYTLRGVSRRPAQVWLVGFGDSTLNFELVVWVTLEGVKRPGAARAEYLWEIHSALERHGIEIPFPQQDLHVRTLFGLEGAAARDLVARRRDST